MINSHPVYPSERECGRISQQLESILFNHPVWTFTFDHLLYIFNKLSNRAPATMNVPIKRWGDCIAAIVRMKQIFTSFGTKGTYLQLQNKHAITASIMIEGDGDPTSLVLNNKAANKKLLKILLPHRARKHRKKWIEDCNELLTEFNAGNSRHLCKQYDCLQRESFV